METIECRCQGCQLPLGAFVNLWTRIGRNYFSPIVAPQVPLKLRAVGAPRAGEANTLVEGCFLQDIVCQRCKATLGIECRNVPKKHILNQNQILLRRSSFGVFLLSGGRPADLAVKQVLALRTAGRDSLGPDSASGGGSRDSRDYGEHALPFVAGNAAVPAMADLQVQIEMHRADIDRIDKAGFQIVAAMDTAVSRMAGEVAGFQESLRSLRRDVGGSQDDVTSLKAELGDLRRLVQALDATAKSDAQAHTSAVSQVESSVLSTTSYAMANLKCELASTSTQVRKEMASLKSDLDKVRRELSATKRTAAESSAKHAAVAALQSKELAVLQTQVAELQRQVQKGQAERSEAAAAAAATRKESPSFGSREIDIITSNIARLSSRTSQVETLQMEFAILKSRVQRLDSQGHGENTGDDASNQAVHEDEDTTSSSEPDHRRRRLEKDTPPALPALPALYKQASNSADSTRIGRKRSSRALFADTDPSPKRAALAPDCIRVASSAAADRPERLDDGPASTRYALSSPPMQEMSSKRRQSNTARTTNAGTVDKRYVKRRARKTG